MPSFKSSCYEPVKPSTFTLCGFQALQLFDRKMMGLLWEHRAEFDPNQIKMLKSLWDNKQRGTLKCKTPITYKRSFNSIGKLGYGRLYGNLGSIEQLERDIRATLCNDIYDDVDIVNCHPMIVWQLNQKYFSDKMTNLEYYCNNRKQLITEWTETFSISEGDAKDIVIRLINGGSLDAKNKEKEKIYPDAIINNEIIKGIKQECDTFISKLIGVDSYKDLLEVCVSDKKEGNWKGTFVSLIYQSEEVKCLEAIVWTLQSLDFVIDVLSYDGCMVRKNIDKPMLDEHLRLCEDTIKRWTGYDLVLKIKPMADEVIYYEELKEVVFDNGYAEMKEEFEKNHCYFIPTGTIIEQSADGDLIHFKLEHATERFNVLTLKKKTPEDKVIYFLAEWRKDPTRRMVNKFVYKLPEDCAKDEMSVFKGFHYKRLTDIVSDDKKREYIKLFNEIIRNMVGGDDAVYTCLLKHFARLIQKPFERPDICIILSSKTHGVGKDTLINLIAKIIGKNTAHYTSDESFWDKHDTTKEGAILVHLEEAGATNKKMADQLKALITSEIILIRPCGVSAYAIPNVALNIMSTNREAPIKFETSDRRFFIINCISRVFANEDELRKYWSEVYAVIKTDAFIKTIGEYLESIDLTGFNTRYIPETEYKNALMESVKTSEVCFLEQWVSSDDGDDIGTLYNKYKGYCVAEGLSYKMTSNSFAQAIIREKELYNKKLDSKTRRARYFSLATSKPEGDPVL